VRIDYANPNHVPLGNAVLKFSEERYLESSQFTDTTGAITHQLQNVYDANKRLSESMEKSTFGTSRILYMYN
jgi:isopentenyl phosphate kinase